MTLSIDAGRCPICGQPNRCANEIERATGVPQDPCWCTKVDFASELLAQVPPESRRLACICPSCAARGVTPPDGPPAAP